AGLKLAVPDVGCCRSDCRREQGGKSCEVGGALACSKARLQPRMPVSATRQYALAAKEKRATARPITPSAPRANPTSRFAAAEAVAFEIKVAALRDEAKRERYQHSVCTPEPQTESRSRPSGAQVCRYVDR